MNGSYIPGYSDAFLRIFAARSVADAGGVPGPGSCVLDMGGGLGRR